MRIVAPTLLWTGILVFILVALVLLAQFSASSHFKVETAGTLAEQFIPLIAAFFSAGVLDAEMKRGAHELLRSKYRPLWHTLLYRLVVSLLLALLVGTIMLGALHWGVKRLPLGMLLLASIPSALCLALISLWTRLRLGNAFMGYMAALAVWLANLVMTTIETGLGGIVINPLLTMTSYTHRLHAEAAGALETTPFVDWWWVSKIALMVVSAIIFYSVTRRVENLVEAD
ncbi:MAG: hypothetical protein JO316_09680 [Abitibacteriaceae bacterium]|nr:hypothetical protein [Abditibacteriaceae bacterium]